MPGFKVTWPEVIGMSYTQAESKITRERTDVHCIGQPSGTSIPSPADKTRVVIFLDRTIKVVAPAPKIG